VTGGFSRRTQQGRDEDITKEVENVSSRYLGSERITHNNHHHYHPLPLPPLLLSLLTLDRFYLPVGSIVIWDVVDSFRSFRGTHLQGKIYTARKNGEDKDSTSSESSVTICQSTRHHIAESNDLRHYSEPNSFETPRAEHKSAKFLLVLDCDNT
jgi:hypothetical protein